MAPSMVALFLVLNLALLAAAQGCGPYARCCPINTLKLGVCADVLNLVKLRIGVPENEQCCPLLGGLADLDTTVCLCTAIRANILGIKLNVPTDLTPLLNQCGKKCASDFTCPI
uniref:Cortical cell-delineating protein n=1 Tax=Aegilops tauschii TaxID=37682 RepID=M8B8P3_AEGTA